MIIIGDSLIKDFDKTIEIVSSVYPNSFKKIGGIKYLHYSKMKLKQYIDINKTQEIDDDLVIYCFGKNDIYHLSEKDKKLEEIADLYNGLKRGKKLTFIILPPYINIDEAEVIYELLEDDLLCIHDHVVEYDGIGIYSTTNEINFQIMNNILDLYDEL